MSIDAQRGIRALPAIAMKHKLLLLLVLTASPAVAADEPADLVVSGLSIVDVETGQIREGQTLLIRDGVIRSIGSDERMASAAGAGVTHRDFEGRFAIPGLWDMHVHLRGGPEMAEDNRLWMRQYVGYGVTSIRDAGGDIPSDVLSWKAAIASRSEPWPRIFTALRKVDGRPALRQGSVEIASQINIPGALESLKASGADFIKVNDGVFPDSIYLGVVSYANQLGLKSAGHVPVGVSVGELAKAGLGSVEHAYFLTKFASAEEERLKQKFSAQSPGSDPFADYFGMFNEFAATVDDDKAIRAFRSMAEAGIAITPTIYLTKRWFSITADTLPEDDAGYFDTPASILRTHDTAGWIAYMNARPPGRRAADLRMISEAQRLVGLAARHGVTILAGTDTGTTNTFMYPGDSLHHEMVELVQAGLTPREALAAATVNAASWFGLDEMAGSIATGKWADIVILDDNPLADIGNTRSVNAVIRAGILHDRESLEQLRQLPGH